jgi:hypothetical protein
MRSRVLTEKMNPEDLPFWLTINVGQTIRRGRCKSMIRTGQEMFSAVVEQNGTLIRWLFPFEVFDVLSGNTPLEREAPPPEVSARIWYDQGYIDCDLRTVTRIWNGGPISCVGLHSQGQFVTRHLIGPSAFRVLETSVDTPRPIILHDGVDNGEWPELMWKRAGTLG